ncbi:hypothetical protein AB0M39_23780 [Streptomyces sp. NPDC051907]|uniref:hypothetical protein n=1 Tax=Streptomyces sp. NPDC051907 TaxID=3155284 RepID=UPI003445CB2B
MDTGVAAIAAGAIGVVGATLGGLAAIIGAKIGADKNAVAILQQVNHQAHTEHAQWVRAQRATAYAQFLRAWDEYTLARGKFHIERPPKYENWRSVQEFSGRLSTAAFAIRIVGPESITTATEQALSRLTAMALPADVRAEFDAIHTQFRETDDPQLQDRMTRIAEEILYNGSWDQAIDVVPLRQGFLQAATDALGEL